MIRTIDMNKHQRELFNGLRKDLNRGFLPAALLNPVLLAKHNRNSPSVANIQNESQKVCLNSLLMMYVEDGVMARKICKDMLFDSMPKTDEEMVIYHDPHTAKIHTLLDRLEDDIT